MNMPLVETAPAGMSEAEWRTRADLAALYRVVAHFRMTDLIYTHISASVPGEEGNFLINHYGVLFHEMRPSDLVKINLDGKVLPQANQESRRVNEPGFVIHSAIHGARKDLKFVIHTHTAAGIAVSAQKHGLLPISQHAMQFHGHLAYHGYEGVAVNLDERARLVKDLGTHKAMILRNHGLLVGGRTAAEAFSLIYTLERACQAQVQALSAGAELINYPAEDVPALTASQTQYDEIPDYIDLAWAAALRLIDGPGASHPS
jgi:ribulose-5-phosphate 4-epimerase/fuculose-1-phosphate aldolase